MEWLLLGVMFGSAVGIAFIAMYPLLVNNKGVVVYPLLVCEVAALVLGFRLGAASELNHQQVTALREIKACAETMLGQVEVDDIILAKLPGKDSPYNLLFKYATKDGYIVRVAGSPADLMRLSYKRVCESKIGEFVILKQNANDLSLDLEVEK